MSHPFVNSSAAFPCFLVVVGILVIYLLVLTIEMPSEQLLNSTKLALMAAFFFPREVTATSAQLSFADKSIASTMFQSTWAILWACLINLLLWPITSLKVTPKLLVSPFQLSNSLFHSCAWTSNSSFVSSKQQLQDFFWHVWSLRSFTDRCILTYSEYPHQTVYTLLSAVQ